MGISIRSLQALYADLAEIVRDAEGSIDEMVIGTYDAAFNRYGLSADVLRAVRRGILSAFRLTIEDAKETGYALIEAEQKKRKYTKKRQRRLNEELKPQFADALEACYWVAVMRLQDIHVAYTPMKEVTASHLSDFLCESVQREFLHYVELGI